MTSETLLSIFLGIGLAASVGFRLFIPLFALSLAAHLNLLELNESWEWISSLTVLVTLGIATIVEVLAYYIPLVDNLLDTVTVPLAAIAGTAVMLSTIVDLSPFMTWALSIIAGGGAAVAIAGTSSVVRLTSTGTTAGLGNPIISILETVTSILITVISLFIPILAIILVVIVLFIIFRIYKKFKSSRA